jgi:hypothetical protein
VESLPQAFLRLPWSDPTGSLGRLFARTAPLDRKVAATGNERGKPLNLRKK